MRGPLFTFGSSQGGTALNGVQGGALNITLTASGGAAPNSWTMIGGALPGGITLNASGMLSGTPTAAGTFTATVQVTDSNGATATQAFTLTVLPQPIPPVLGILGNKNIQLTGPTVAGFHYQIEYNADLSQWFPIGSLTLATGATMTWTDDGLQTGTTPATQGKRFYRLLISQ